MEKIGRKLLSLEKKREEHRQTIRKLDIEEIAALLDDAWGDTALVAALLDMSPGAVRRYIKTGKIKATKGPDNRWWIPIGQFADLFGIDEAIKFQQKYRSGRMTKAERRKAPILPSEP